MSRHYDRGRALYQLKRYREAAAEFTAELGERPNCPLSHGMLAASLVSIGDLKEAETAGRRTIELSPNWQYGYYVLGNIQVAMGQSKSAEQSYREALRLEATAEVFFRLGLMRFKAKQYTECLEFISQGLALNPRHVKSLVLAGKALNMAGRPAEGMRLLRSALEINAENAEAHHELGRVALHLGQRSESSLDHLLEARRIDPVDRHDPHLLAIAYGRSLFPFTWLLPVYARLKTLTLQQQWMLVASLTTVGLGLSLAARLHSSLAIVSLVVWLATLNLLVLFAFFDIWAKVAAISKWRSTIQLLLKDYATLIKEAYGVVTVHLVACALAFLSAVVLPMGFFVLSLVVLNWNACSMWRRGYGRIGLSPRLHWTLPVLFAVYCAFCLVSLVVMVVAIDRNPLAVLGLWPCCLLVSFAIMRLQMWLDRPAVVPIPLSAQEVAGTIHEPEQG